MIIAVSGNVGSGKTTLAKYISEKYCFDYIPQHRLEFDFIDDFFNDIEGKFFPAQVSFLLSKAIELQELYSTQKNIVIDRSLLEDIDVFARLWIENRNIDPKIIQLYKHTAEFIKASVPPPDVYLICRCPAEVSISRIDQRKKRHFEDKYPPNHVQMLEQYYSMLCIEQNTPYVNIDTVYYDFKDKSDLEFVCNEIFSHLEYSQDYVQLSFLESTPNFPKPVVAGMDFHNFSHHSPIYYKHESKRSEYIYFAAPFTQVAEKGRKLNDFEKNNNNFLHMIQDTHLYGELPEKYRRTLIKIQKALERKYNHKVFIPHKEINKWGKTSYPPEYLAPQIVDSVKNAFAFVAIPGNSLGVHLELGIAISQKIPTTIFDVDEYRCGYLVKGLAESDLLKYYRLPSIHSISNYINQTNILEI